MEASLDPQALDRWMSSQAISEALVRYCRGVDRCDEEMVRSLFHEDATDDHGIWRGSGHDFATFIVERGRGAPRSLHYVTNLQMEFDGPDRAFCESYWARLGETANGPVFIGGRYLDRFERRDGQWKVADRLVVYDIDQVDAAGQRFGGELRKDFTWGMRDRSDPSYRR